MTKKIDDKQYIIAIGASAGGLEAISAFFDYTPLDAVSYIIIQHLSADFKSQMAAILAPHSKLQVLEALENVSMSPLRKHYFFKVMKIEFSESDNVYLDISPE